MCTPSRSSAKKGKGGAGVATAALLLVLACSGTDAGSSGGSDPDGTTTGPGGTGTGLSTGESTGAEGGSTGGTSTGNEGTCGGETRFANSFDHGNLADRAADVAVDNFGGVYAFATVPVDGLSASWLFKTDSTGATSWTQLEPNSTAFSVALSGAESLHTVSVSGSQNALLVHKYDLDGGPLWRREYVEPESDFAGGQVAARPGGGIWVATTELVGASQRGVLLSYDDGGSLVDEQYVEVPTGWLLIHDIEVVDDDLVVAGSVSTVQGDFDVWVQRRQDDATIVWEHQYDEAGGDDQAFGVAATDEGAVVVAGSYRPDPSGRSDGWVRRLSAEGKTDWTATYEGEFGREDRAFGVAVSSNGTAVVYGTRKNDDFPSQDQYDDDMWLQGYSEDGDLLWTQIYSGEGENGLRSWDLAVAIAASADGKTVVALGDTFVQGNDYDVLTWSVCP